MRLLNPRESVSHTPESMFASKYAWLLRWALHFSQNDQALAEDLVQETFVKLLLSWSSLCDLDNIEPLLYSYLKYAHLEERRRGQQYSFQSLSTIDFDTLAISLSSTRLDGQIKLRDELWTIVDFLLWRKGSARFASIFILRFFHGYFPEEIMQICRGSRHAVDLSLRYAREELQSHLNDPRRIQVIHAARPRVAARRVANLSEHAFVEELRKSIFTSRQGECLKRDEIKRLYASASEMQVDTGLLAHFASCERCLDEVSRALAIPPTSRRTPDDSFGPARRARRTDKKGPASEKDPIESAVSAGQRRVREIREHTLNGFMIALNGQVIAARDINSHWAELKVETHSVRDLDLIEAISDQGLPLLVFPLLTMPPETEPEQRHEVQLSGNRRMELLLRFTTDGALIEITFDNPSFACGPLNTPAVSMTAEGPGFGDLAHIQGGQIQLEEEESRWQDLLSRLQDFRAFFRRHASFVAVLAGVLIVLAAGILWSSRLRSRTTPMQGSDLLSHATVSDAALSNKGITGAIHQTVEVRSRSYKLRRELYRDIQGKRRAKPEDTLAEKLPVRQQLEGAGVSWNNPLSAADFTAWHGRVAQPRDVVTSANNLLTLTTTSQDGVVEEESLTVRADDFHPVMRNVQLRDRTVIEVAEVNYAVVPWNAISAGWFEKDPEGVIDNRAAQLRPQFHVPVRLTASEIDEAELSALLALKQLHADTERLQLTPGAAGVEVKGVVETKERQHQINAQLRLIPHVTSIVLSYSDLDQSPSAINAPSSMTAVSVSAEPSPLERYCDRKAVSREDCATLSHDLLRASADIHRESRAIDGLLKRFSDPSTLTASSRATLHMLLVQHLDSLAAATEVQDRSFAALAPQPGTASTEHAGHATLPDIAQSNLKLTKELVYAGTEQSREASTILIDLANSALEVRTQMTQLKASSAMNSVALSGIESHQP